MSFDDRDIYLASIPLEDGSFRLELSVPGIHCGGCIRSIEGALGKLEQVTFARVNLSARRLTVRFSLDASGEPPAIARTLRSLGFESHISGPLDAGGRTGVGQLVYALAVAGFAAMNIMMLSVGVWAGADQGTRVWFHWISASIAFPALLYSGRIFGYSAWSAVRSGRVNMDVPITVGLVLTYGMSLYDTVAGGEHVYFDAATMLLFFLLVGRTLDLMMRERARAAIFGLERMVPAGAELVGPGGSVSTVALSDIEVGMTLRIAVGDRIPVDCEVKEGRSAVDKSLVTGESVPHQVGRGSELVSGSLNLSGPLVVTARSDADGSFLAEMIRLIEAAEHGRGRYRRLADRVSSFYAPVVHVSALVAFAVWWVLSGDVHRALGIGVSVLIITCPCALALAVPMVQVRSAVRLLRSGILMASGSALERITGVDTVVYDKTGTLTDCCMKQVDGERIGSHELSIAVGLSRASRHPYAVALAESCATGEAVPEFVALQEYSGQGIEGSYGGCVYRLGRADWAVGSLAEGRFDDGPVLSRDGVLVAAFGFDDRLRPEAHRVVRELGGRGMRQMIVSGDGERKVSRVAGCLGIADFVWGFCPADKRERVEDLIAGGRRPLMIGDGVNDAAALAAAHVSVAPSTATDIGRNSADFVFLRPGIGGVLTLFDVGIRARILMIQNIVFALLYNVVAVPLAFFGLVTPLVAALAMSGSSLVVVANSLRLGLAGTDVTEADG